MQVESEGTAPDAGGLFWLLITGAPRSGTSLVRNLVDEHPQASILLEYGLTRLVRGLDLLAGRPRPIRPAWRPFAEAQTPLGEAAAFYVRRGLAGGEDSPSDLGACGQDGLARAMFSQLSGKPVRLVGDKTPLNDDWEDIAFLRHHLPELKLLVVVREPAMVIRSSMIRRARQRLGGDIWPIASVQEAAFEWWSAWRRTAELMESFGEQARLVRYEDLCDAPDPTMARLWKWLGLDPHLRRMPVEPMPARISDLSERERAVVENLVSGVSARWRSADPAELLQDPSATPRPYVPGTRLAAASGEADDALAEGFSFREDWGRWTDGLSATIRLRHGEPDGHAVLEIEVARAFAPPGRACDVVLRLPSGASQLFSLGSGEGRIAALCDLSDARTPGLLEAELVVMAPKPPFDPPSDERRLGLGVAAVTLRTLP